MGDQEEGKREERQKKTMAGTTVDWSINRIQGNREKERMRHPDIAPTKKKEIEVQPKRWGQKVKRKKKKVNGFACRLLGKNGF